MPRYLASQHAVDRLLERFPGLRPATGTGLAAARWLGRIALQGRVVAQQAGMDLMLRVGLRTAAGVQVLFLPVTPLGHADTWVVRTVLTEDQAQANIAACVEHRRESARRAWLLHRRHGRAA